MSEGPREQTSRRQMRLAAVGAGLLLLLGIILAIVGEQSYRKRALAQAGLDTNKTNLEFSLRQQHNPFAGMMGGDQRQQPGHGSAPRFAATGSDDLAPMPAITLYRGTASAGGVNIFV